MSVTISNKNYILSKCELQKYLTQTHNTLQYTLKNLKPFKKSKKVNPISWTIGHIAHFYEQNCLNWFEKDLTEKEIEDNNVVQFDSNITPKAERWSIDGGEIYYDKVYRKFMDKLQTCDSNSRLTYLVMYAIVHTYWHIEDIIKTKNMMNLEYLRFLFFPSVKVDYKKVFIKGRRYILGDVSDEKLVFDSDKGYEEVEIKDFYIDKYPVTNEQFLEFVKSGEYNNKKHWTKKGYMWKLKNNVEHPKYWLKYDGKWKQIYFGHCIELKPNYPVMCINNYEAQAYCNYTNTRLPTEEEWELACKLSCNNEINCMKFGDNCGKGVMPVNMCDDNVCVGMLGNIWEWTNSDFTKFDGFEVDIPYKAQSEPFFGGNKKVLKGGSWSTIELLIRPTYRNFQDACDNEWFVGFRTCS